MKRILFLSLVVLAVGLRLVLGIYATRNVSRFTAIDTIGYSVLTRHLVQEGRYTNPDDPYTELFRPPGYPLFLLPSYLINGESLDLVPLMQTLLALLAAWLIYRSGKDIGQVRAGEVGALLYLINPNAIYWSLVLLSESLAGFFTILVVWLLVQFWRTGQLKWGFLAGLALGLGALTRPILNPLWIGWGGLMVLLIWYRAAPLSRRIYLSGILAFVLGSLVVVTPWQLRNYVLNGHFTISMTASYTLEYWNASRVLARAEGMTIPEAQKWVAATPDPNKTAWEIFRQYPRLAVLEQVRGTLRTLLGAEYASWARAISGTEIETSGILSKIFDRTNQSSPFTGLSSLFGNGWFWVGMYALTFDVLLFASILIGFIKTIRQSFQKQNRGLLDLWVVAAAGAAYLTLIPLANGDSRFRAPADPLLCLVGGFAWQEPIKPDHD